MIKQHYAGATRRAMNLIWNAAQDYSWNSPFLAFHPNGDPDDYMNMVIGLTAKWLDAERITDFFERLGEGPTLDEAEIAEILPKVDRLVRWAEDVRSYALSRALAGTRFPGYKLVEGRSNRKYSNEAEVARIVTEAGYDPYEKQLLGVTSMTKRLGKKRFDELLSGLVEKPRGKPVLAPETDKRPEFNTAANDFRDEGD